MRQNAKWPPKISRAKGLLHTQIANAVSSAIEQGRFRVGDKLPPERELAEEFGVNRLTVRQALAELQSRHLIKRRTGRKGGTFIAEPVLDYDLTTLVGFSEQVRRLGRVAGAKVISATRVPSDAATSESLQLPAGAEVFAIERLRLADGVPVLLENSAFPAERFAGLLEDDLSGSIYDALDHRFDARPRRALESFEPVKANARIARLLGVTRGAPLLRIERTAFDVTGVPVEFARDLFRGDRTRTLVWSFDVAPS